MPPLANRIGGCQQELGPVHRAMPAGCPQRAHDPAQTRSSPHRPRRATRPPAEQRCPRPTDRRTRARVSGHVVGGVAPPLPRSVILLGSVGACRKDGRACTPTPRLTLLARSAGHSGLTVCQSRGLTTVLRFVARQAARTRATAPRPPSMEDAQVRAGRHAVTAKPRIVDPVRTGRDSHQGTEFLVEAGGISLARENI
jgi:hypothetical protein